MNTLLILGQHVEHVPQDLLQIFALFELGCKLVSAEEIVMLCRKSEQYWIMQSLLIQEPCSPLDLETWPMIVHKLTTNYNEFVSFGETANINLRENFRVSSV